MQLPQGLRRSLIGLLRFAPIPLILALGVVGFKGLVLLRKPPAQQEEKPLQIEAVGMRVQPEDAPARMVGFGTAQAHQRSVISAQVSGRVVWMNPNLENGKRLAQGDVLFEIEKTEYESIANAARADVDSIRAQIEQLKQQEANDQRRLEVIRRTCDLARRQFERYEKLGDVEATSIREKTEQEYTSIQTEVVALENTLALYPIQIRQTKAALERAQAQLAQAQLNLERTVVRAPFFGRVDNKKIDLGQTVAPPSALLDLIDDSRLEISVPLEGVEVARWIEVEKDPDNPHWINRLPDYQAQIYWTDSPLSPPWLGRLDRVERFDSASRTLDLVVSVDRASTASVGTQFVSFPLLEGMFCRVEIPGRTMHQVFRLPRGAVSHEGKAMMCIDGRMKTRQVQVVRFEGDSVLVGEGLAAGDIVLTSRPAVVLEGLPVMLTLTGDQPTTLSAPSADSAVPREVEP